MTSISSFSPSMMGHVSPRDRLQNELTSEVTAGTVSSADQAALSSAIDAIDSSLKSAGETARKSGSRPSPDEMKSKISDLIADQVSAGNLTQDQADELSNIFEQTFAGGPGGASGPPPGGPPPSVGSSDRSTSDSSSTSATSSTEDTISELLNNFLKALQEKIGKNSNYGADGQTSSVSASLIINFQS